MYLELLNEIRELILRRCCVGDLVNLACCSSQCYDDTLKRILWECALVTVTQLFLDK